MTQKLEIKDMDPDPYKQFDKWFREAVEGGVNEPESMVLATSSSDGQPSARMVLLKDCDQCGFVFFTNYESRKALEMGENPHAALLFYWPELSRQVRIVGQIQKTSREESERYFNSRLFENREVLDQRISEQEKQSGKSREVPLPTHWGGYRVCPVAIEFWQKGPHRLHDRFLYSRGEGGWMVERLAP